MDSFLQQAFLGVRNGLLTPLRKLRVLFCLPHHNITGGESCTKGMLSRPARLSVGVGALTFEGTRPRLAIITSLRKCSVSP